MIIILRQEKYGNVSGILPKADSVKIAENGSEKSEYMYVESVKI